MLDTHAHAKSTSIVLLRETIEDRARAQLRRAGYLELHNIDCAFHEGKLVLQGVVTSYYLFQLAQTHASGVDGVHAIDNRIVVQAVTMRAERCG